MKEERAILAGGCFWGMQDLIRRLDGVISTETFVYLKLRKQTYSWGVR